MWTGFTRIDPCKQGGYRGKKPQHCLECYMCFISQTDVYGISQCLQHKEVSRSKIIWNTYSVMARHRCEKISPPFWNRITLQWRHNERNGVSNYRRLHCLLNCWFKRRSKKTPKLRVTGLCAGSAADQWIPCTKGQLRGKCFHLMASSSMAVMQYTGYVIWLIMWRNSHTNISLACTPEIPFTEGVNQITFYPHLTLLSTYF